MLLKTSSIANLLEKPERRDDPLAIVPTPAIEMLRKSGTSSIDLRLGRWFANLRHRRIALLDVKQRKTVAGPESRFTKRYFVPFHDHFVLHPGNFVLGITLEWIRLPANIGAQIGGKSSWGRRGLIIETASGVHPGFAGCLTLEIANVGEIPIAIRPGMTIAQLFLFRTTEGEERGKSQFHCNRRPSLGEITVDPIAAKLIRGSELAER